MLASTLIVSTHRRIRAYLIAGLMALTVMVGSVAYEVRSGDTLSSIAAENDVALSDILAVNDIANPDLIRIGQSIVIPGEGGSSGVVHNVTAGDTLARIAQRYGASTSAIAGANDLRDPNVIRVGQRLQIPGGSGTTDTSFHVVEAGETLSSIAAQHGVSATQIAEANGITDPSRLYVGTRLALNGSTYVADTAGEASTASHTVEAGETLASIARSYGVGISDLAEANDISDPHLIRAGQTLRIPGGGWVCPVPGGSYVNDWGFPRKDERFHEGNDLFAPRGTEVLAPVGGEIDLITGTVGGLQFYLYGDDGVTYIGTHLEAFGRSGRVEAGQVIGYVGDTGNARGGPPHLHFEMHPDDGAAVNPYPTLRGAGC